MLIMDSTCVVNLITGSATDIDVVASYIDINTSTNAVTPRAPTMTHILTAATTVIVAAPSAGTVRNVKALSINNEGATANLVEAEINNGYGVRLIRANLAAGESVIMGEDGQWSYYAANGAIQVPTGIAQLDNYGISGSLAETMPRNSTTFTNQAAQTSGTLFLQAIYLRAGTICSSISFHSATTAAASLTNQIFGLYDGNRNLLASTANDTTTAWAANTLKTLNIATPYTITQTGLYYLGCMVAAGTMPSMLGVTIPVSVNLLGQAPILHGTSTTGLTTTLPATAAAITIGTGTSMWGCIK